MLQVGGFPNKIKKIRRVPRASIFKVPHILESIFASPGSIYCYCKDVCPFKNCWLDWEKGKEKKMFVTDPPVLYYINMH